MVEIRRKRAGDRENDRGRDPARKDLMSRSGYGKHLSEGTDAIAITVLKVSSMNSPSNIFTLPIFARGQLLNAVVAYLVHIAGIQLHVCYQIDAGLVIQERSCPVFTSSGSAAIIARRLATSVLSVFL